MIPAADALKAVEPATVLRFRSFRPVGGAISSPGELPLELLKVGHRRAVYRSRLGDLPAIVKLSIHPFARLKLERERRRLLAMRERGLPAPRVLGCGPADPRGWALITEEYQGATSFLEAWRSAEGPWARRHLMDLLSGSIGELHRAGVEHTDPHPQNLLVGRDGAMWIDASALRLRARRPLSVGRADRNLAALYMAFNGWCRPSPGHWVRALRAYLRHSPGAKRFAANWARGILRRSQRRLKRFVRRRSRRCLRTNRDFVQVRREGLRGAVRRDAMGPSWDQLLERPDSFFEGASLLKDGRSTRAARIVWNGRQAFLKRYHRPGAFHRFKYLFRRSRAFRSWAAGHHLELASVPVTRPLAALDVRRWGWPRASYLITEWADGVATDRYLAGAEPLPALPEGLLRAMADAAARLHFMGLWHRDLKPPNVFFDPERKKLSLVDLDGVRRLGPLSAGRRLRDLARWLRDCPEKPQIAPVLLAYYREHFDREQRGALARS